MKSVLWVAGLWLLLSQDIFVKHTGLAFREPLLSNYLVYHLVRGLKKDPHILQGLKGLFIDKTTCFGCLDEHPHILMKRNSLVIRDAMAMAFAVIDAGMRMGMSLEEHIRDPFRTQALGDVEGIKFDDGSVGFAPSKNSTEQQVKFIQEFGSIYQAGVNNYNDFYNDYITQQNLQSANDQELVDAINRAKQEAWDQTQMVLREQDRLEKTRQMEISVLETDRSNQLALEKLLPLSKVKAPVVSSAPSSLNLLIASAIILTAFALR